MENCIEKSLKGVVNDNSLRYVGGLRIKQNSHSSISSVIKYTVSGAEKCVILSTSSSCHFTNSTGTVDYGTEVVKGNGIDSTYGVFYITPGNCEFVIISKYTLGNLLTDKYNSFLSIEHPEDLKYYGYNKGNVNMPLASDTIDYSYIVSGYDTIGIKAGIPFTTDRCNVANLISHIDSINSLDKVISFYMFGVIVENIPYLAQLENLQSITFNSVTNPNSDVPLSTFGGLTNLKTFTVGTTYAKVVGSIEDFVAAQRTAGRTTCDELKFPNLSQSNVTWKGIRNTGGANAKISWTATTITFYADGTTADTITA